jgi:HAD superfamily hydrolase (TIGR01484 family)
MLDLRDWPGAERGRIAGVFTDIDDTLTTGGAITADALAALARLRAAGVQVIPITGRPAGWSEPFAMQWPVDAIVAENGALALVRQGEGTILVKLYQQDARTRAVNSVRMRQAARRIVSEVPGAVLSRDSAGRETDIAIDHAEFVHLPAARVAQVVRLMQEEGMNATVSSIHINGWYGGHNKLSGARWIVRELFGRELDAEIDRWVYVGDSPNDVLMFEHFPHSVGVANIRRFEAQLTHPPRYITQGERGAGFAEVARAILAANAESDGRE